MGADEAAHDTQLEGECHISYAKFSCFYSDILPTEILIFYVGNMLDTCFCVGNMATCV